MSHQALSDSDYERLSATLSAFYAQGAMSLETLDGFFAALIAGPEVIRPAEYLPLILGAAFEDETSFATTKAFDAFMHLLSGHWLDIARTLEAGEEFHPWLEADGEGKVSGNDWAEGFERGMALLPGDWQLAFDDSEAGAALAPIMMLALERDPDPAVRTVVEQREELLGQITPAIATLYAFYTGLRARMDAALAAAENDKTLFDEPVKPAKTNKRR
ncbi:UPF0149 family protein [Craterilacuibacter sp. RT1T]|uniref:UPF0149 family protein n=1 Tax=Craterilacuibacter sp. RT1T TaxID=2942211 RepID=UPI0020BE51D7|nr:UPF0149 family protein [Craterilacuibacter sp. RT1T]MCL6263887.1 UPF0149 family protein [Craterilacuibacter sp. RT1T]